MRCASPGMAHAPEPRARSSAIWGGRCLPDRGHRRNPARIDGAAIADLLFHGNASGFRSAHRELGQRTAGAVAPGRRRPAGVRCVESRARRHASVQEPSRAGQPAPRGADRGGRASARDPLRPAGSHGVRGHGGGAARISLAQCGHLLSADRRRRRQCLRHALSRQRSAAARRRSVAARRRMRT